MTGTGTLLDPYVIWDVDDLQDMNLDLTAYYELGQDIDAAATVGWNLGLGFDPIGDSPAPAFTGNFDGKGFKITDLVINRPLEDFVGLFGYTAGVGGEVKNVDLETCQVTGESNLGCLIGFNDDFRVISNCEVTGQLTVSDQGGALQVLAGGLTGYTDGATSDCRFSGTFILNDAAGHRYRQMGGLIGLIGGGTVTRCSSAGTMTLIGVAGSEIWEVGGFAGMNAGAPLDECFSTMDISVAGDDIYGIGGFIADNSFPISDCYARGDVTANGTPVDVTHIAGFCALNTGALDNVYSTGLITTNGLGNAGGLIAETWGGTDTDSFWDTDTSGMLVSDGGTGLPTAQMKDSATFIAAGWGFGAEWGMTPPCNDGYPCLLNVTAGCLWAPVVPPAPYRVNRAFALAREEL